MKKAFFALVYAVLTAVLFSSCDTTGGRWIVDRGKCVAGFRRVY